MNPVFTPYAPPSDRQSHRSPRARRREALLAGLVFGCTLLVALLVR